ncbi:similar to Saccharomyces cerevisiae YHR034C PIH1 Protein of unresolved function [Maudiozyma saulgeensis]|uniref:Similar to Saccharomyces cerevisiae YHR034C PIH1 Protein of unresolved function n=1 Tax=Maudiozyma saulgeensis TaxID=1789683 RepID=A0A1X7QZ02_9SACH|nr:similar to Saccharomyces cerevisiae YHR034C PIH1 Protein of unresolved function [Kazachstania saulgeensis]
MNDYIRDTNENNVITIIPEPIFVIKSKLLSDPHSKLFINVCHAETVPPPKDSFDPLNTYTAIMNNQWEIPIVTSQMRQDTDKKGELCVVSDCIINSNLVDIINNVNNFQLKQILVEWCIESVEIRENVMIQRDTIKFPKMKFKGNELPTLEIRNDSNIHNDGTDQANINNETDSVSSFLQMKRDLIDNDEIEDSTNGLKTLFPTIQNNNKKSSNPLIQDITDPNMHPTKNSSLINEIASPKIIEKKNVHFNVSMRHTKDTTTYKLRIEIESELNSSLDLELSYKSNENSLFVKNINLQEFNESNLEIPLPDFIKSNNLNFTDFKTFFIKKEHKLYIFI